MSRSQGALSPAKAMELEEIFSASSVEVGDCLRLSEFIAWQIERILQSSCQDAAQEISAVGQQEVLAKMRTDLFHFCIRTFILQLLHSLMHRNSKIKLTSRSCTALLGYIHQLHATLKYRLEQEPIDELNLICQECFDHLDPIWAEFQRDPNKSPLVPSTSGQATAGPAEDIMANVKEGEEGPVVGSKVDAANRNYRMAYGMAVGIEASVRVADGMKLYNSCVYGMVAFREELEKQMQLRELPFTCQEFAFAPDWPGSEMSHDIINFALSTITMRYSLPENGCMFSPSHILGESEDVWFEDLAPALFSRIRKICNVDSKQYLDSVARREFSFIEFTTNSKSGEVFFFSHDGKFLLKTISNKEAAVLLKMLPEYFIHLQHQTSFLMRICGLHRVCTGQARKVRHFLVAISVFDCKQLGLHHQFDLKGSTSGRVSGPKEQVKKDVNWMSGRSTIWLPIDLKRLLASIVEEDGKFLANQNVLDYSILIGIHDRRSPNKGVQCRSVKLLANILRDKVLPLISKVRKLQRQNAEGTPRRAGSSSSMPTDSAQGPGNGRMFDSDNADTVTSPTGTFPRENSAALDDGRIDDGVAEDRAAGKGPSNGTNGCSEAGTVRQDGNGEEIVAVMPGEITLAVAAGNGDGKKKKGPKRKGSFKQQLMEELKALSDVTAQGVNAISPEDSPVAHSLAAGPGHPQGSRRHSHRHDGDSDGDEDSHRRLMRELDQLHSVASARIRSSLSGQLSPDHSPPLEPNLGLASERFLGAHASDEPLSSNLNGPGTAKAGAGRAVARPLRKVSISPEQPGGGTPRNASMVRRRSSVGSLALWHTDPTWSLGKSGDDTSGKWKWEPPHGPIIAPRTRHGEQGRFIYLIGIIDFLTPWSNRKRLEFGLNVLRGRRNTASCVPPMLYAKRQQIFFTSKVLGMYTCASAIRDSKIRGPTKDTLRPDKAESFNY